MSENSKKMKILRKIRKYHESRSHKKKLIFERAKKQRKKTDLHTITEKKKLQ